MDNNTILRIKVPANLYESVKEQLTLKESKNRLLEAISGTDEELMAFYEKVKQMEAEGTDLESAINYAKFDIENPDAAKELSSMNEAKKQNYGAGYSVVKEKKMKTPKDGMKKVEETIEETDKDMEKKTQNKVEDGNDKKLKIKKLARKTDAKSFAKLLDKNNIEFEWLDVDNVGDYNDGIFNIKVEGTEFLFINGELDSIDGEMVENKEKNNSMEKKMRTLDELKKAKDALDKKIHEMEGMDKVEEVDLGNLMDPNFIGGVAAILGVGVPLVTAAIKDMKKAKTPEEKAAVRKKLANAAGSALSGNM